MSTEYNHWRDGFEENYSWAMKMQQRHTLPLYQQYWQGADIIEIDKLGDEASDDEAKNALETMDYSGMDKLIVTDAGYPIWLSQRIRPDNKKYNTPDRMYGVGFSIRTETFSGSDTEIHKLGAGIDDQIGCTPAYAFGVADVFKNGSKEALNWRELGLKRGLKYLAIYNTSAIIKGIRDGSIPYDDNSKDDGTSGRYIKLKDIEHCKAAVLVDENNSREVQGSLTQFNDD